MCQQAGVHTEDASFGHVNEHAVDHRNASSVGPADHDIKARVHEPPLIGIAMLMHRTSLGDHAAQIAIDRFLRQVMQAEMRDDIALDVPDCVWHLRKLL
ncbi:hypothetical protein WL93_19580 [Burkholderia diffusa]|nr:hypothetical protein WL93_19580 [Burkholderia diffusa]